LNHCPELLDLRLDGGEDIFLQLKILAGSSGFKTTSPAQS